MKLPVRIRVWESWNARGWYEPPAPTGPGGYDYIRADVAEEMLSALQGVAETSEHWEAVDIALKGVAAAEGGGA